MKRIKQLNLTIIAIFMSACSTPHPNNTSHDSDRYTTIQKNKTQEKQFLQKHLDAWLEEDWNPAVQEKYEETKDRFKLQDYLDKLHLYNESLKPDTNESNINKMESMPVIGK